MPSTLVIQLARFGDLIQTKRLVNTLSAESQVHLLVDTSLERLARLVYPRAQVHAVQAHAGKGDERALLAGNQKVFAELAAQDFRAVYNCNFAGISLAVSRLFPPDIVRGHVLAGLQPLRDNWTELGFRLVRERAATSLNLVDYWAHLHSRPMPAQEVNPVAEPKGGGLGVVMAGRNARRSLPVPVLARAVQAALARTVGKRIVLLGTAAEAEDARELTATLTPSVAGLVDDLCGRTDWEWLVDVVAGLDMLLTPDTGTMHLAAHLGTPVAATFLSSAWCHETGPYGAGHLVWQAGMPCAPCLETAPCQHGTVCLEPFGSPDFLRALGGDPKRPVDGLTTYRSRVDELGADFVTLAGNNPHETMRAELRGFLKSHLNLSGEFSPKLAHSLYQERDWMVPQGNCNRSQGVHD